MTQEITLTLNKNLIHLAEMLSDVLARVIVLSMNKLNDVPLLLLILKSTDWDLAF